MLENEKKLNTFTVMEEEHNSLKNTFLLIQSKMDNLVPGHLMLNQKEELSFLFNYFQKRLAFHFNIEESIGILNDIREMEPHFYDEVMLIQKDHASLLIRLKKVYEYLQDNNLEEKPVIDTLIDKFTAFLNHLKHHEETETTLVLKAANTEFDEKDY